CPECIGGGAPAPQAQPVRRSLTYRPLLGRPDSSVPQLSQRRSHRVSHSASCTSAMPTLTVDSVVDPHENRKHALIAVGFLGNFKWRSVIKSKIRSPHPFSRTFPVALKGIDCLRKASRHTKVLKR